MQKIVLCYGLIVSTICAQPMLEIGKNSLNQLFTLGLIKKNERPRLHLGCGLGYKKGYINVDFPPSEHTIQKNLVADVFCDITKLGFPSLCVQEIRSHHVFEHFFRQTALVLLCAWQQWLVIGGQLIIEVPDFKACLKKIENDNYSYAQQQLLIRHVFGSHEAVWAVHCDGWYREKFEYILRKLGFDDLRFEYNKDFLSNITVYAIKRQIKPKSELMSAAHDILRDSQNGPDDVALWRLWCNQFDEQLNIMIIT